MGRTGIIMGFFFVSVTTFSILEQQQHTGTRITKGKPEPVTLSQIVSPEHSNSAKPDDYMSDELCCDDVVVQNIGSYSDLKRELNIEKQQIDDLKKMQASLDQQLYKAYQHKQSIEKISKAYVSERSQYEINRAQVAVDFALENWVKHDAQIDHLAKLNSKYRLNYLPDSNRAYRMNQVLTKEMRSKDKLRAATDARIQYLNEIYRRQNAYLQQKLRPSVRRNVALMPVYR
ncbi:MAG: hypothetical protein HOM11_08950 [Methylococcales bacterium]|jgi:hypothetical protein|nr:hypothetical protein [Methylococcales bacterium]MBT7445791.1 hypothetical protein [Methylococcales bacterium]